MAKSNEMGNAEADTHTVERLKETIRQLAKRPNKQLHHSSRDEHSSQCLPIRHRRLHIKLGTAYLRARTKARLTELQISEAQRTATQTQLAADMGRVAIERRKQRRRELLDEKAERARRFLWTPEIEGEFLRAVRRLGGGGSPYRILVEMQRGTVPTQGLSVKAVRARWKNWGLRKKRVADEDAWGEETDQELRILRERMAKMLPLICQELPTVDVPLPSVFGMGFAMF